MASGSASKPKVVRGCEKLMVTEVIVKSEGDRTLGVFPSVAGGEPQAVQVVGTVNFCIRVENVTVRLESERVSVVPPSGPVIGMRVVEVVYAPSGSGICINPAWSGTTDSAKNPMVDAKAAKNRRLQRGDSIHRSWGGAFSCASPFGAGVTGQQRADYGTTKQKLKPRRTWQAADG